ncbi:MAG: hypothetical protein WCD26_10165 [Pseudolabrys sp.]
MATSKLLLAAANNLMGKVRYRYLEAGLFMFQPKNLLLPNLPDPAASVVGTVDDSDFARG